MLREGWDMRRLAAVMISFGLAACSAQLEVRGFVADPEKVAALKVDDDNRASVTEALGTPTAKSTFDDEIWYYISERAERVAFLTPTITDRQILALVFDADTSKLKDIGRYTIADGRVVEMVPRATPAKGRELSILQQLFGNIGRFGAIPNTEQPRPGAPGPGGP
jgi:outer membrane protein assembly factor BamE (lipoprotein component of BamABCDE complex)